MKKLTMELVPGDKIKFGPLVDEVVSVELPKPPHVLAKVTFRRTWPDGRVEECGKDGTRLYFYCGVKLGHEML